VDPFTVQINSPTAGTVTIHATTTFSVGGVSLTRATGDNVQGGTAGTVSSATNTPTTTLTDSTQSWTTNQWANAQVKITSGTGAGQTRTIVSNTGTTLTLLTNWTTIPDSTSKYEIEDGPDATKVYQSGNLIWVKHDNNGALLGGATFLVTGTSMGASFQGGVSVVDVTSGSPDGVAGHDQDVTAGNLELTKLALGTYTIQETKPPMGFNVDPTTYTVIVTASGQTDQNGAPFTPVFVDTPVQNNHGLTPGFWKNNATKHGAVAWKVYTPSTTLSSVFTIPASLGGPSGSFGSETLLTALQTGGGGLNALMRQAAAALLNSTNSLINYPLTTTQVISKVNAALADPSLRAALQSELEADNSLEGGVDQHGNPI
jgi:hypothetical protein